MSTTPPRTRPAPSRRPWLATIAGLGIAAATLLAPTPAAGGAADGPTVSPGMPADTSTSVTPVAASSAYLQATGVAPLPAPVGFGAATTGGAGGQVVHVTSADDSVTSPAPGTLRHALQQPGPTWIVFDQDLTISFAGPMDVPSDTTIDGRGRHVVLTGHGHAGLRLYGVQNVVVEGLELRDFGDIAMTQHNDPDDAIDIFGSVNVWIDHSTFSMAGDKLIAVEGGARNLTFSWNRFHHQEQTVQIGMLPSANEDTQTTVTMAYNHFDHVGYRLPAVSYGKAHVYNNYLDSWTLSGVRSQRLAQTYLESNVFVADAKPQATIVTTAQECNDSGTLCDGRSGYLADVGNVFVGKTQRQSTGTDHVFDPSAAYSYSAEPATAALAERIAAEAGVADQVHAPATTAPPTTAPVRSSASLRARNARSGKDVLTLVTENVPAGASAAVWRKSGRGWRRIHVVRMSGTGTLRISFRDSAPTRRASYRCEMAPATGSAVGRTNVVSVR